uniref:Ribosomal protein S11 n=1 Tax=Dasya binghamiae TaxID=1896963 RepID=A0A1C8XRR3_9FLOR|nr:ribosomal protein S11 [Dasya binghamiae]AOH77191.1 ribosomal protein S11 [Dasya binghamiae]
MRIIFLLFNFKINFINTWSLFELKCNFIYLGYFILKIKEIKEVKNNLKKNMLKNKSKNTYFIYILFTFNNIFYILLDLRGSILLWTSSGRNKIKGLKKITLNSIKMNLNEIFLYLLKNNKQVNLYVKLKGLNKFKKILINQLKQYPFNILSICDETVVSHNGCKLKKSRKI